MERKSNRKESDFNDATSEAKFAFISTLTLTFVCFNIINILTFLVSDEEIKNMRVWFYIPFVVFFILSYITWNNYKGHVNMLKKDG